MRGTSILAVAALLAVGGVTTAMASGWDEFWARFHVDFHRNNCWPEPFVQADRVAARSPFELMKHNGWRQQNTLSHDLFHHETHELTHAGVLKTQWIVSQNPPARRAVYVLKAAENEATEKRIDAVQRTIARVLPSGTLPPVVLTSRVPISGSGAYFDQIERRVQSTIPNPRLPEASGLSAGGGGNN